MRQEEPKIFICRNKKQYDYLMSDLSNKGYSWSIGRPLRTRPYIEPIAIYVYKDLTVRHSNINLCELLFDEYSHKEVSELMKKKLNSVEKSAPNLPHL